MAKSNLNQQSKRKRELAKMEKRAAKDEKRAQRKDEARATRDGETPGTPAAAAAKPAVVTTPYMAAIAAFKNAKLGGR